MASGKVQLGICTGLIVLFAGCFGSMIMLSQHETSMQTQIRQDNAKYSQSEIQNEVDASPAPEEAATVQDGFSEYRYTQTHEDGSSDIRIIYKHDDNYIVEDVFCNVKQKYALQTVKMTADEKFQFDELLDNVSSSFTQEAEAGIDENAMITVATASGSSTYSVAPLDLPDYGLKNGWTDSDDLKFYGSVTKKLGTIFNSTEVQNFTGILDEAHIGAYMKLLYQQIKTIVKEKPEQVSFSYVENSTDYQLSVKTATQTVLLYSTQNGYVYQK